MKKNGLVLLAAILFLNSSFLFAGNSFGSADLNKDDELVFTVKQDAAGTDPFTALFYTKLKNGKPESGYAFSLFEDGQDLVKAATSGVVHAYAQWT